MPTLNKPYLNNYQWVEVFNCLDFAGGEDLNRKLTAGTEDDADLQDHGVSDEIRASLTDDEWREIQGAVETRRDGLAESDDSEDRKYCIDLDDILEYLEEFFPDPMSAHLTALLNTEPADRPITITLTRAQWETVFAGLKLKRNEIATMPNSDENLARAEAIIDAFDLAGIYFPDCARCGKDAGPDYITQDDEHQEAICPACDAELDALEKKARNEHLQNHNHVAPHG